MGFDPSIVSQIGQFLVRALLNRSVRSPFVVGFFSVMNKSLTSVKRRLV